MNIDEQLKQLASMEYPERVDVVDAVMAEVQKHPYLQPAPQRRRVNWRLVGMAAAAALAALVVVNVAFVGTRSYDEEGMSSMIAQLNDYSSWNTVEQVADDPYEYFFEERGEE